MKVPEIVHCRFCLESWVHDEFVPSTAHLRDFYLLMEDIMHEHLRENRLCWEGFMAMTRPTEVGL